MAKDTYANCVTVQQLIDGLLKIEDKSRIVILQKDAEGNGYSPLHGVGDNYAYKAETGWSGEVRLQTLTERELELGYEPGDDTFEPDAGAKPCLVLQPKN